MRQYEAGEKCLEELVYSMPFQAAEWMRREVWERGTKLEKAAGGRPRLHAAIVFQKG